MKCEKSMISEFKKLVSKMPYDTCVIEITVRADRYYGDPPIHIETIAASEMLKLADGSFEAEDTCFDETIVIEDLK